MNSKIDKAFEWLIKHGQWDESNKEIFYTTEDGQRKALKRYSYGSYHMVYVPTAITVSFARAIWAVIHRSVPETATFIDGVISGGTIEVMSKSNRSRKASELRPMPERLLPRNVYATSGGRFIGRKGALKTMEYDSAQEALNAVKNGNWLLPEA